MEITLVYIPQAIRILKLPLFTLFVIITFSIAGSDISFFWKVGSFLVAILIYGFEHLVNFLKLPESWKMQFHAHELFIQYKGKPVTLRYSDFKNTQIKMPPASSNGNPLGIISTYNNLLFGIPSAHIKFNCGEVAINRKVLVNNQSENECLLKIFERNFDSN